MSLVQGFEVLAVLALAVAIGAGVGLYLVFRRLQRFHRNQHVIMGSRGDVDIVEHVASMDDKLANMRVALEDLTLVARDHDVRIDGTLARIGVVRFDAYQDLGGRQSAAVAFLNSLGNGVVITTVVSRDFARMYVKLLKDGVPDIPLAPEESEAVDQARGAGPFTIKPRVGVVDTSPVKIPEIDAEKADLLSSGLPGRRPPSDRELARENRRRKRQGLPLVVDSVTPSAVGWAERETPSPEADSLAAQYVRKRRAPAGSPNGDEYGQADDEDGDGHGPVKDPLDRLTSWTISSLSEPLPVAANTIGFLGPQGTFTEVALRDTIAEQRQDGRTRRFLPLRSPCRTPSKRCRPARSTAPSSPSRTPSRDRCRPRWTSSPTRSTTSR